MESRDVIVVGGSAGSLEPLRDMISALPADLSASVAVTMHVSAHARSRLPWILSRSGPLPAVHPSSGERLQPAKIYVAPPGRHLLLPRGLVDISNEPRVNRHRPAVDAMFASAARWFGDRVVAVVLSGMLDDGAVGAALVQAAGGQVVVQEPREALYPSMPQAALAAAPAAIAVPGARLAEVVTEMLNNSPPERRGRPEVRMEGSSDLQFLAAEKFRLTRLTCPDWAGVPAESVLPAITCYRCPCGHQFGSHSPADAQSGT